VIKKINVITVTVMFCCKDKHLMTNQHDEHAEQNVVHPRRRHLSEYKLPLYLDGLYIRVNTDVTFSADWVFHASGATQTNTLWSIFML